MIWNEIESFARKLIIKNPYKLDENGLKVLLRNFQGYNTYVKTMAH